MLNFIHSRGDFTSMESFAVFPKLDDLQVTVKGKPVTRDPDFKSPSEFEWIVHPYGYFKVTQNRTVFNFSKVEGITFCGELGPPLAWEVQQLSTFLELHPPNSCICNVNLLIQKIEEFEKPFPYFHKLLAITKI